jgi:hypothetical protein
VRRQARSSKRAVAAVAAIVQPGRTALARAHRELVNPQHGHGLCRPRFLGRDNVRPTAAHRRRAQRGDRRQPLDRLVAAFAAPPFAQTAGFGVGGSHTRPLAR